ncbi:hypothetical protein DAPPUDRAFT_258580 [Daphnia pulex]|uniref:Uncharacterized protein n=1 Tax=Daphnia pulex TaxID=6669 RepID=E9HFM8_DAPPU|nr:hypothetical protein DAPPUDRAFT_258580 [Daphnia pulex]|eukprot:EFX69476.1 hypothetical protein DAPPUDRAFT_258580 [Daphnia pulex]
MRVATGGTSEDDSSEEEENERRSAILVNNSHPSLANYFRYRHDLRCRSLQLRPTGTTGKRPLVIKRIENNSPASRHMASEEPGL